MFRGSTRASMWCLRSYYFKMALGTVKKAIDVAATTKHDGATVETGQKGTSLSLSFYSDCNCVSK